jgi:hypothetical protein
MISQRKTTQDDNGSDRFSEELYFMLMSSALRTRVLNLASKYDLSPKQLHDRLTRACHSNDIDRSL